MRTREHILKKALAGFLLVLFAFSITPKKWLHDLTVDHTDTVLVHHDGNAHVQKAGYNCDCNNLVAESLFTPAVHQFSLAPANAILTQQEFPRPSWHSSTCFFIELRGPPSVA